MSHLKLFYRKKYARKYFGDEDPVGKFLDIDSIGSFEVVGIIEETKNKSHVQFEVLASAKTLESLENAGKIKNLSGNWGNYYTNYAYVVLIENADLTNVQNALDAISIEKYEDNDEYNLSFYLQPLEKIVPGPLLSNELGLYLPKVFVIFLAGLALVIIISAAFNYTSLSLARSLLRAKEVGVRKTIGATRKQIIIQFLLEAVLITMVSLIFAYLLLQVLLPAFSGMQLMSLLEIRPEQNFVVILWFLIFALVTGIIAGLLPSLFVSSFNPINVLKGVTNLKIFSKITLRKILLVSQYVFSIVFIVSIILIFRQMDFMVNAKMGFDRDIVYNIQLRGHDFKKVSDQLSQIPEVSLQSNASHIPGIGNIWDTKIKHLADEENITADYFSVDPNYISTMGLELISGQDFPKDFLSKNEKFIIINELAVERFNFKTPEEAIGASMLLDDTIQVEIIGVVKDYKYAALFLNQKPLILRIKPSSYRIAVLRINSPNIHTTVSKIEKAWKQIDSVHEMEGDFLDSEIREYYKFFEDVLYTVGFTTLLAIVIASLGLFGMATYSTQTKLKEIGVRKVFGANSKSIAYFISKSYLILLLIAAFIAGPLGYYVNNLWLQNLAFHVSFGFWTILAGVLIVVLIALVTISSQTLKAANTNPANVLKYE